MRELRFQVNRVRTFSLQHRMKLARQYKVKQRYLNKLLESFNEQWNPEAMRKHVNWDMVMKGSQEAAVRAALDLHEVPPMEDVHEKDSDDEQPGLTYIICNPSFRAESLSSFLLLFVARIRHRQRWNHS